MTESHKEVKLVMILRKQGISALRRRASSERRSSHRLGVGPCRHTQSTVDYRAILFDPSNHLVVARTLLSNLGVFGRHLTCSTASEGSGCVLALATLCSLLVCNHLARFLQPSCVAWTPKLFSSNPRIRLGHLTITDSLTSTPSKFLPPSIHIGPCSIWVQYGLFKAILPT
jgi:hypothetical protein